MSTISPRFVQGLQANITYWRDKIEPWNELPLDEVRRWNTNIHRAVQLGLQLEVTREMAAQLALMAAFLSERVGNWEEWAPILQRLLKQQEASLNVNLHWRLLVRYGQLLRMSGRITEAVAAHENAEEVAISMENPDMLADAWMNLADNHFQAKQYEKAQYYGQKSLALFRELKNTGRESVLLLTLAHVARTQGQAALAEEYLRAGIAIEKRHNYDSVHLGRLYNLLAIVMQEQQANEEAVRIYQEALAVLAPTASELDRSKTVLSLGTVYFNMERYEEAEQAFRQADTPAFRQSGDYFSQAALMQNFGNVKYKLQQYDSAMRYLNRAEQLWQKAGESLYAANTIFTKSEVFLAQNQREAACKHIQMAIQMSEPFAELSLAKRWLTMMKAFQSEHCDEKVQSY